MKAFASFILRGRMQATIVAIISAVLSLIFPPSSHVTGATIGLVTLRNGAFEGALIMIFSGLILGGVGFVSAIKPAMVMTLLAALFLVALPVVLSASVLRATRSMGSALTVAGAFGVVVMLAVYLSVDDVHAWWRELLTSLMRPMIEGATVDLSPEQVAGVLDTMSGVMTGFMAAALVYTTMINIFIARWWQAMLFNPGGFRKEFFDLRLARPIAVIAMLLLLVSTFATDKAGSLVQELVILAVAIFSLHGLALVHTLAATSSAQGIWLTVLYLLMFFLLPQVMLVLSTAGLADCWFNFRSRLKVNRPPAQGPEE